VMVKDEDSRNTWMQFMPLKLAWCLTIHKSQGMTLDAVVLSLGDVYNYGQGYTALSRVRDLNSVRILDVEASSFRAHPDVIAFYA
jgi:ATP-dependent DNA helicase PIF1